VLTDFEKHIYIYNTGVILKYCKEITVVEQINFCFLEKPKTKFTTVNILTILKHKVR